MPVFPRTGSYGLLQCFPRPCRRDAVWPSAPVYEHLLASLEGGDANGPKRVKDDCALPACPHCGAAACMNVRGGNWFLEDHFQPLNQRLAAWLAAARGKRLVVLEIGAGFNTPGVVRLPCEAAVRSAGAHARLIRVKVQHPQTPADLGERCVGIAMDAEEALARLCDE